MISWSAPPVWPTRSAPYHSATASKYGADEPLDVVADPGRQLGRVLDDEARPAVQRAPDPERDREPVAALDRPVARAEQPERGPRAGRQHQVAGERRAVPVEQADRLALGHPRPQAEQQPADAVRGLAGGVLERGELLDLVDHPQAVGGVDQQVGGVLDRAARPGQPRAARRRGRPARRSSSRLAYVFQPTTPTRLPGPIPSSARISASGRERSRGWPGRLRSWKRCAAHRQRAPRRPSRSTRCRRGWPGRRSARRRGSPPRSAGRTRSGRRGWRCARGRRRRRAGRSRRPSARSRSRSRRAGVDAPPGSPGSTSGIPKSGRSISASRARRHRPVLRLSSPGGCHGRGLARRPARSSTNWFGRRRASTARLAVGPLDADLGLARRAEPDVDPAELAADVAAADGQLAADRQRRRPGPRSRRRSRRGSGPAGRAGAPSQWPIGAGCGGVARADVAPEPGPGRRS